MKFHHCRKANIYSTDKVLLCEAVVSDLTDNTATLTMENAIGNILRTEALVTFLDSQRGLITCFCRLSDYQESFKEDGTVICTVRCEISKETETLERRNDLKVSVDITVRAHFQDLKSTQKTTNIRILDLSAGGLFCISKQYWALGQIFIFPFWADNFSLTAEILRQQAPNTYNPTLTEEGLYGYGCRFIDLSPACESALRAYIFKLDLLRNRYKK